MTFRMRIFLGAIVAIFGFAGIIAPSYAQDMKFWRIGTGGAGGTYYPIGGLIANAISNPQAPAFDKGGSCGVPGLVAIAVSTNASVANVNAIDAGQLDEVYAQSVTQGFNGEGKFAGAKKEDPDDCQSLSGRHAPCAAEGTKLGNEDLVSKKVGVAAAGSGTQVSVRMILKHYDIKANEFELNLGQSGRLADGQIDAFFYAGGTPFAALIQLGSTKGFELYTFSEAERKEINSIIPYYVDSLIPAGTYENVTYDVPTVAVSGQLITSAEQPEDLIYEITKALWNKNTRKLLDKGHAKGKQIRPETALKGVLIPIHPGAEKFYKESRPYQVRSVGGDRRDRLVSAYLLYSLFIESRKAWPNSTSKLRKTLNENMIRVCRLERRPDSWNGSFYIFPFFSQATIISLRALERPSITGIWVSICPGSSCWFSSAIQSSNQTAL